jgi:DNA (cytosine-5)-methyltransferase 1
LNTITEVLTDIGYDVSYKIIDSARFKVPQSRKRIYIVGFLGSSEEPFPFPKGRAADRRHVGDCLESDLEGYSISERLQQSYLYKIDDGRPITVNRETRGPTKTLVASYHKIQRLTGVFVEDGPTGLRLFSEGECKALMGFPKDFVVPVSRTQMYRQFGNSVVVPVVKAVARRIFSRLRQEGT